MTPNQAAIDGGAPTIDLAGQKWPIPEMSLRYVRHLDPILNRLLPLMAGESRSRAAVRALAAECMRADPSEADLSGLDAAIAEALTARGLAPPNRPTNVIGDLTDSQIDDLVQMGWLALKQAHPTLELDAFLAMPIRTVELISAFSTIFMQTKAQRRSAFATGEA